MNETVKQQALEWQVVLWSGEVTKQEEAAFNTWLEENKEHKRAWEWLQSVNQPLDQVSDHIARRVLRQGHTSLQRRKILFSLGLLGSLSAIAYGVQRAEPWQIMLADESTKIGERRTVTLSDGTRLTLNTDTAVDIDYTHSQRKLHLHRGELMITTGADVLSRPFTVMTDAGAVQPIGTRFSVRRLNDSSRQTQVRVYMGGVQIVSNSGQKHQLNANQEQVFSAHQIQPSQKLEPNSQLWEQGKLIVERETLANVIAELRRYRPGIIRCDPAVRGLIVSGVYPLDDTDAILQSLVRGLPITISTLTPYWVSISAHKKNKKKM